jgi:hypothetical protein
LLYILLFRFSFFSLSPCGTPDLRVKTNYNGSLNFLALNHGD